MTEIAALKTVELTYGGRTVALADLPEYARFYRKLTAGQWEPQTLAAIARHAGPDTVVLDIGAWIGVTSFYAARTAKAVIAVDPDPQCLSILRALAQEEPKVTVVEGALSDRDRVTVNAVEGFGSSETSVLDIGDGASRPVPGLRMDDLFAKAGHFPVFAKIDIEGYEFVIPGEIARLAEKEVRAVQLAVHPQLFERTLSGYAVIRRLRTAVATWRLGRILARAFCPPRLVKYGGLASYIVRGVLCRKVPRGADFLYERRQ